MIYLKNLENTDYLEAYKKSLINRGHEVGLLDQIVDLNKKRKSAIQEMEQKKSEQNKAGESIALKKRQGEDASAEIEQMQSFSRLVKELDKTSKEIDQSLFDKLVLLPNLCDASVPVGGGEADNVEVDRWGEPKSFSFEAKPHDELGTELDILDFERGSKVAGARFTFLKRSAAKLERALMNFMIDLHTQEHGYQEIIPPYMVNSDSLFGTGNFPKFKEDVFHVENTDYYLIPTAEVPVTNLFRDEILDEAQLPLQFSAYSSCFRSEAGSYGQDTKGLIRQHQFEKVELMSFVHPDRSEEAHEALVSHAEKVLQRLGLAYRKMALCTGDISFGAAKCYDLEVWLPGQQAYREISSCSNFKDFQARRANIRFRPKGGKPQFVHTLNGSGLAIGRTLLAVMENYQREDGSIEVPEALVPYFGASEIR